MKPNNENSRPVTLINTTCSVATYCAQEYLGLLLEQLLNFNEHIQIKMCKLYNMIGVIKRLFVNLLSDALLRIYKLFIRPHLNYSEIVYDKPNNNSFIKKTKNIQYETCIGITGAIQGTSREPVL